VSNLMKPAKCCQQKNIMDKTLEEIIAAKNANAKKRGGGGGGGPNHDNHPSQISANKTISKST
jgi:hypothetical protein